MTPQIFTFQALGCQWTISLWDTLSSAQFDKIQTSVINYSQSFDDTYSRFKKSSLVWNIAHKIGTFQVTTDFIAMLKIYFELYDLSEHHFSPLIGQTLSDMGYDLNYSLQAQPIIATTPDLIQTVKIISADTIQLNSPVLFDFGGLGKGYLIDRLVTIMFNASIDRFLINGSGDIYYQGNGHSINVGLEDPRDASKVIGVAKLNQGALCASASNRRRWSKYHHIINPLINNSPEIIQASWVISDSTAIADALASCLFLTAPDNYSTLSFDYCLLNHDYKIKRSANFQAELFY